MSDHGTGPAPEGPSDERDAANEAELPGIADDDLELPDPADPTDDGDIVPLADEPEPEADDADADDADVSEGDSEA